MRSAAGWRGRLTETAAALRTEAAPRRRRLRAGLLDLYLIRGAAGPFLMILLAVGAAMMLERALRLVHELAASGADIAYFFPLLARLVPYYLDLAIPAAFMVSLVLLVARLDDRLELEAMLASGWSLSRIAAPLVALGAVVGLFGLVAGGWLEPQGRYGFRTLKAEAVNAGRIGRLQPRALYHPADSLAVTFDRREPDGTVAGIFVWQRLADGRELVLTGAAGRIGFAPEGRLFGIDLARGRYVASRPGEPGDLIGFDRLAFRESLLLEESRRQRGSDQKEMTLPELSRAMRSGRPDIARHALEAEYYSSIARAAIVPLLPLLVLPLAFATKKGRRGLGILLCGALLAAFHHAMNSAKSYAAGGGADPLAAIAGVTALCAAVVLLVFLSGRHLPSHSPIQAAIKPVRFAAAHAAAREPSLPSLSGRTLAAYLGWQLGKWTLLALLAIVALLQMVDLFERGDTFVELGLGPAEVLHYAWLRLPAMVQQAMPIAALTGAMATFSSLGRSLEITAIRAAGISQWRILLMALPVPLLLSLASLPLAEYATPRSQLRLAAWWESTAPPERAPEAQARWFRIGGEIVRAKAASPDVRGLALVEIFRRDASGRLVERVSAARAEAGADGWSLIEARVDRFDGRASEAAGAARLEWRAPLQPGDVAAFFSSAPSLSAAAARRSLGEAAPVSQSDTLFATRLYRSAAEPLAPLVMLLLALPLAFVAPRTGAAWPALLYAGAGGLLYLAGDGVATMAAQAGYLPAAVGAWAAPVVAALTGITVLLYAER